MPRTPRKERISRYSHAVVCQHVRKKHPGCPDFAVERIAAEIAGREWKGATLGRAVGIVMQSTLRHLMTEYETLLLHGIDREDARRRVQPKIEAMLAVWKRPPVSAGVVSR
ncbi:DUF2293 domain-containing protein [Ensifer sp. YR511]|uniref:DUF2293 domain-containing protein n=1 Tax=Ensifer sp. YR511 TaxID=1855294 RepID=UPI00088A24BD|nr:DUF2293 domain-containing protein [Ensifer sp. YR511]SDM28614.1 hypothetical protein SAMN05216328_107283 [Ensifer sp. YR511]